MLDKGQITAEEAARLLGGQTPSATPIPLSTPDLVSPSAATAAPHVPPTPTPGAGPPERASAEWIALLEHKVHALTNEERRKASLAVLSHDDRLAAVARGHSRDMAAHDYFSHENHEGHSASDRGLEAGYRCFKDYGTYYTEGIAENIFQTSLYSSVHYLNGVPVRKNYMSIEEIARRTVEGWMNSPGHRRNILEDSYDLEGIGVAVSTDEKVYVTQNFC